jgi:hypothetical protein
VETEMDFFIYDMTPSSLIESFPAHFIFSLMMKAAGCSETLLNAY